MDKWIDLTQPIDEDIPVRPAHEKPSFEDYHTLEEDGMNSTIIQIETHVGTHMDSPAHFLSVDEHRTIDQLTTAEMITEGAVLDFSYKESGTGITREEMETEAEKHCIGPGDYAILKLGTKPRDDDEYLMEYIYPTASAVEHLLERGIVCLASEALNVDRSRQSVEEHTVHYRLLEEDVFIVEGLDNLDTTEEGRYDVICTPLPYVGRDGSQVRFLVRSHEL